MAGDGAGPKHRMLALGWNLRSPYMCCNRKPCTRALYPRSLLLSTQPGLILSGTETPDPVRELHEGTEKMNTNSAAR